MTRQDGRMVDDALVGREVDHLDGDELGAGREHVQVGSHRLVLLQHLGQYDSLRTPACELEHRHAVAHRDVS